MTLHEFQKQLLLRAELTENEYSKECYRDCVNFSGAKGYELRADGKFSEATVIKATTNYQLTRFGVPKEVLAWIRKFPNDFSENKLKTDRPKQYQPIKKVLSFIKRLKVGSKFRMRSIDGGCEAVFVKYENETLNYTMITDNPVVSTTKIRRVALHRIIFIKNKI